MKEDRGASVQTRLTNGGVLIMDVGAVHLKVVGEHLDLISGNRVRKGDLLWEEKK